MCLHNSAIIPAGNSFIMVGTNAWFRYFVNRQINLIFIFSILLYNCTLKGQLKWRDKKFILKFKVTSMISGSVDRVYQTLSKFFSFSLERIPKMIKTCKYCLGDCKCNFKLPSCKDDNDRFTTVPLNFYLIYNSTIKLLSDLQQYH